MLLWHHHNQHKQLTMHACSAAVAARKHSFPVPRDRKHAAHAAAFKATSTVIDKRQLGERLAPARIPPTLRLVK